MNVAVSTVAYDGYPFDRVAESLASIGATRVEPAWVAGLTEPFDERAFGAVEARRLAAQLAAHGLSCDSVCAPVALSAPGALDAYRRRLDFVARVGARALIGHAGPSAEATRAQSALDAVLREAERRRVVLLLSNTPGDDLIGEARDAAALAARVDSPWLGLCWDPANALLRPVPRDPHRELSAVLPRCGRLHLKDLRHNADGWFHAPLGEGSGHCAALLAQAAPARLPITVELPLRLHRQPDGSPSRSAWRVPLADIESVLRAALAFVRDGLLRAPAGAAA